MTTPVFGSSSAQPPPGRKGVGILLAPMTGRTASLAIVGAPLALFLILGFTVSNGSGSSSSYGGQSPYDGQSGQSQPNYPLASPTYTADAGAFGFSAAPDSASDSPSPTSTDADGFGAASASDSPTATATATATDTPSATPSPSATGPAAVVLTAYADINRHDYQDAYKLGLARQGETYQSFVEGYSSTQSDTVTITGVAGDVVSVSLAALSTDGSEHDYSGTYTVTGGYITGANLQEVN